jgi:hypothetical protein
VRLGEADGGGEMKPELAVTPQELGRRCDGMRWRRLGLAPWFYCPEAALRKERGRLRCGFGRWKTRKLRDRRLEEGGAPNEWAHGISDTQRGKTRGRLSWASGGCWARPTGSSGGKAGRARGKEGRAPGGLCWAGPNPKR